MTTPDLLPCPFCGGKPYLANVEMVGCSYVVCTDCRAQGDDMSKDRAIATWNTRAPVLELIRQAVEAERERMREVYHGPLWRLILGSEECLQAVCADTSGENCHCGKKIKRIERFAMLGAGE